MKSSLLVKNKIQKNERLSFSEAVQLFSWPLLELGILADQRRQVVLKNNEVGFIIDRNITFTDICSAQCNFCAFYKREEAESIHTLSLDQILEKIEELVKIGGTQVMLQGGLNPANGLSFYQKMLSTIKKHYPQIYLHSLSPAEIHFLAQREHLSYRQVLQKLREAGLDSLPGAAEILVDRVRKIVSPHKLTTAEWLEVMEAAHSIKMETTATMTFGMVETKEERITHLLKIRELQDKTGKFRAFIPWTFSPTRTKMPHLHQTGGEDYLKTVAISRLVLDNIKHIHAGWVVEGWELAQLALLAGANDLGGILMDEVVIKATGIAYPSSVEKIIKTIKQIGRIPVQRNSKYEVLKRF